MNLRAYDFIVINSSAGKDSQAMTDHICRLARGQSVLDRVVLVHCDLGRVEWNFSRALAQEHAAHYGVRFEVVRRERGDLIDQVRARGMWPDSQNRYCTSDQKRDQVSKLFTKLCQGREHTRILNCQGLRAQESADRATKLPFFADKRNTHGKRHVDIWLPLLSWSEALVWETIRASGVRYHYAYDLGMKRLSCCFCVFAPESALLIAGRHNPELLAEYVALEKEIGHTFRHNFSIARIQEQLRKS